MKLPRLSICFIALFLMAGCSSIYMPNVPNTPMLSQQGELAAGAHVSLKGNLNFNTAYALTNQFALMANGGTMRNERERKDLNHKTVEIGAGYFNTFGVDKNRIFEIYGGFGSGKNDLVYRNYNDNNILEVTETQKSKYDKKFLQLNYSAKKKDDVRLFGTKFGLSYGTALRVSFVKTHDFYLNGELTKNEDNIFIEPVFFTRMRLSDQVQLQYTSGGNFGLKNRKYLNAGNSVFSLGVVINLGAKPQ